MTFIVSSIARALLVLPPFMFGMSHFTSTQQMAGLVPPWLPGATFWVYLTGTALIAASLAIVFRIKDRAAGFGLALLLASIALTVHLPGMMKAADPSDAMAGMMKMMSMSGFFKDLALAGGALLVAISSKGSAKG